MRLTRSILLVILSLATASSALAGFNEYNDRSTWQASAGATSSEDFNSIQVDTPFSPGALALPSGLTLQALDSGANNNFIDVEPISSEVNVNGSPVASFFNGQSGGWLMPRIMFDSPVAAFGADFQNMQDDQVRTGFELYLEGQLVATLEPPVSSVGIVRFYGFVADAGETFDEILFTRVANDVWGMDDVEWSGEAYSATPVPTLSSLGIILLVLSVLLLSVVRLRA